MVECTGLENRRTLTRTVGSNPTSSAIIMKFLKLNTFMQKDMFMMLLKLMKISLLIASKNNTILWICY